ncbi:MAG: 16S rRNA (adenine(1518)-N(6)/adenine(1519)-N(6))-dimethyltransferase RsmA [Thermoplasmatota archaeon]
MTLDRNTINEKLRMLGLEPTKSLGQHFLIDPDIAEREVEEVGIGPDDTVLEIGPGLGILTDEIVKRAGKTIAIEKSTPLYGYLEGRYDDKDFEIIEGDVLDIELPPFDKVMSNTPFNISSPLTFKLLDRSFQTAVMMYQKEFANRMVAKPGGDDYSRLSVMVSVKAEVKRLFDIPRSKFYPPPRVDATVVKMIPSEPEFEFKYPQKFSEVVRQLFNYRRKKISNSLKTGFGINGKNIPYKDYRVGNITPEEINEIVEYLVENNLLE